MNSLIAVTQAEKMKIMDLPMALVMLAMGVALILLRKQQASARLARVEKGELSPEQAEKNAKIFYWGGYGVTASGLVLLAMWALGV